MFKLGTLRSTLTSPLSQVIAEHDVEHHLYADDTQIYLSLSGSKASESKTDLKSCVTDVFTWMTNSKLKLNPSKTEFIIIRSSVLKKAKRQVQKSSIYYYLTMTHFLKHSLEIRDSFFIVILTPNAKSLRFAKYASITSVTFGVSGSTLAQKLQNLLHVLKLLVILTIAIPFVQSF